MNIFKKITSLTVVLALVLGLGCASVNAEGSPVAKRTVRISVAESSSQELKDTNTAHMMPGEKITFELEQERDDGGFDPIGKDVSDESVIKFKSLSGVNTVTALKEGTSVITFQNVISVNPIRLGTAKLQLTFVVAYDPVESVTLNTDAVTIIKGKTQTLKATVLPARANPKVTWTSSDPAVAKVSAAGKITAVAPGSAVITCVTTDENIKAECAVTVIPVKPDPESLTLSAENLYLLKGKSKKLAATVLPANANKKVVWTTSDKTVAKVSASGSVKGVGPGTAVITCATVQGGLTKSCEVLVFAQYASAESVALNHNTLTLVKGKKQKLTAGVLPLDANPNVTWSTSDKSVAKVSSAGVVTGVKPGNAVITCKAKLGSASATCDVVITPKS